jgi:hypothetical protein
LCPEIEAICLVEAPLSASLRTGPDGTDLMDVGRHLGAGHVAHRAVPMGGAEAVEHKPVTALG